MIVFKTFFVFYSTGQFIFEERVDDAMDIIYESTTPTTNGPWF